MGGKLSVKDLAMVISGFCVFSGMVLGALKILSKVGKNSWLYQIIRDMFLKDVYTQIDELKGMISQVRGKIDGIDHVGESLVDTVGTLHDNLDQLMTNFNLLNSERLRYIIENEHEELRHRVKAGYLWKKQGYDTDLVILIDGLIERYQAEIGRGDELE